MTTSAMAAGEILGEFADVSLPDARLEERLADVVTRLAASDPAFGPSTVTLSNGRVVTNPLATVIRFAYPTRGDGQLTTPTYNALNLRLGRRFAIARVKLEASLDVFNITNNCADLSFQSGANQTYNVLYGTTTFRQVPRSAQVGLRTTF